MTGVKEIITAVGGLNDGGMGEFETRELWKEVAKGIQSGDFDTASKEKTRIEVDQRNRRKEEKEQGTTWPLKHFKLVDDDPNCMLFIFIPFMRRLIHFCFGRREVEAVGEG